ncbi:MAG: DUF2723 domain-containing protein [bacterium]|nr:DUF2723 domain-containing protein [bacterium]
MKSYRAHYLILLISGLFYLFTLAPTLIGGDSSSFCINVYRFKLSVGRASDHPLHTIFGKIFSWLPFELAYSLNLMSAFFGVLTVFVIFLVIKHLSNSSAAAFFGAFSLMVSHAFWQHSVVAEVYTLNAFFVALLLYITLVYVKHWWFPALFPIIAILGLLNHLIFGLIFPALLLYLLIKIDAKSRKIILLLGGGLVSLMLIVLIGLFLFRTQAMKAWIHAILVGPPPIKHYLFPPAGIKPLLKELLFYLLYLIYQYPIGGVLIGLLGIVQLSKKDKAATMLLGLAILFNGLFFIKTTSWGSYGGTKYTFYISDYTVFAVFVGYGASWIFAGLKGWFITRERLSGRTQWFSAGIVAASVILTVILYSTMPALISMLNLDLLDARTLPYRDNKSFFLNPNKRGYYGDRKYGEEILELSRKDAVVFADFTPYSILRYLKIIENKRPDVQLVMCHEKMKLRERIDAIKRDNPKKPVYLADNNSYYNLKGLDEQYRVQAHASFFEITARK